MGQARSLHLPAVMVVAAVIRRWGDEPAGREPPGGDIGMAPPAVPNVSVKTSTGGGGGGAA